MTSAPLGSRPGVVSSFDDDRGLGEIVAGDDVFSFHCTAIADGSRSIEQGTAVRFEVIAGRMGRWEATTIVTD